MKEVLSTHCKLFWEAVTRMFERPHHQRIAELLHAMDGKLLHERHCYFGGGTAIALRYGEYRESVDVDFVVSDVTGYRELRRVLRDQENLTPLLVEKNPALSLHSQIRADQYGIRTIVDVSGTPVKLEIILEGRIELDTPGRNDHICGVPTLTPEDMATCKLLANSDRWADSSVFSRDVIDLAMMRLPAKKLRSAVAKAEQAYGASVRRDLDKAIDRLRNQEILERCMQVMAMNVPKAVLWQNLQALARKSRTK